MKKYHITILKQSIQDLDELAIFISKTCKAPITAHKYTQGIISEIRSLRKLAESIPISTRKAILIK